MIFSGKFSIPAIDTCIAASKFLISKELPSIRLNHPSIPVEGFLPRPLSGSASVLLFVYKDESIPFFHLPGSCTDQVDGRPGGVSHQIHAVLVRLIQSAQAVFHDEQRFLVAVIHLIQGNPKSQRVDEPSPLTECKIWVLCRLDLPPVPEGASHPHILPAHDCRSPPGTVSRFS